MDAAANGLNAGAGTPGHVSAGHFRQFLSFLGLYAARSLLGSGLHSSKSASNDRADRGLSEQEQETLARLFAFSGPGAAEGTVRLRDFIAALSGNTPSTLP